VKHQGQPAPARIGTADEPAAAETTSPAAPPGITCPLCGGVLETLLFTRKVPGRILRVRKCEPCRRRWRTAEQIIPGTPLARGERPPPA
jgi:hypothetical protein